MDFRFKALRHAHDPDDLDTSINLANPKSWIAVFVTLVLMAAAVLWSVFGRLPQAVGGTGVLSRDDGVVRVEVDYQAVVQQISVTAGDRVERGSVLLTVADQAGNTHQLLAPTDGTVMVADHRMGVVVPAGEALVTVERAPDSEAALSAMIAVPAAAAAGVRPGMAVDLSVAAVPARTFGLLHGSVLSVSQYPVTEAGLLAVVYDPATVHALLAPGAMSLVTVALTGDSATVSGYSWTSAAGPPFALAFQSSVTAEIHLGERRPIDYVFGDS